MRIILEALACTTLSSTTALNRAADIIGGRDGSITFTGNKGPDPASHIDFECT